MCVDLHRLGAPPRERGCIVGEPRYRRAMQTMDSSFKASSDRVTEPAAPRFPLARRLFAGVDIAGLVWFRVAFGVLMMVEVWRYFPRIRDLYIAPKFHFTFHGFDWIQPWSGDGMYVHFAALGLAAFCVAIGLCYRLAAPALFLGISYVFLLDQSVYLNHMYLIALVSFLLIFVPAHRAFSVDAWRRPKLRAQTAPAWALWLLRAQIGVPYVYGGLAKLNHDWLRGEPMRMWLADRADRPLLGPLFTQEWVVYLFSYGGLLFDLLVVPALLWRRTRPYAFALALCFHATNAQVFEIGIFPWMMMAATLIFFPPDWPRRVWNRLAPRLGAAPSSPPVPRPPPARLRPAQIVTLGLLATYLTWQLLFPLRHWLYPGDVAWTEEGHKFAWRMKLRDKHSHVRFYAADPVTGKSWWLDTRGRLKPWQRAELGGRPEMILQFAHHLADELRARGHGNLEIHAVARVALNGRAPRLLIDPAVDLAAVQPSLRPASWILHEYEGR